jgi:hypothetical protein
MPRGCQTSKNIALARDNGLAMLSCVPFAPAHNIVRQSSASSGKVLLVLCQAFEHVVCLHRHSTALLYKFLTARSRGCSALRWGTA